MSKYITMDDSNVHEAAKVAAKGDSVSWHPPDGTSPTVFEVGSDGELIWIAGLHRKIHKTWPRGLRVSSQVTP